MSKLQLMMAVLLCFGLVPPALTATPNTYVGGERLGSTPSQATSTFEQRRQTLLDGLITLQQPETYGAKFKYWYAQALLAKGNTLEGLNAVTAALAHQDGDMFRVWAMADTYLRWHHLFPSAMREAFRVQLTGYTGYDEGMTENHHLMLATARFLASEIWPTDTFASDFKTTDPTGRNYLLKRMKKYVHKGTVEFDSPAYQTQYMGTMRSLADLAQDGEVRHCAALTTEWLILENVGEWLDGHWLSGSLRHMSYYDGQDDFLSTDYVLWVYFGASITPDFSGKKAVFAVQAAASAYRLPEDLAAAATDRGGPFVHRETDTWDGRHHYGTTYLDRTYGLYSTMEDYKIHTVYSDQYHRWAVQWLSDEAKSTLYVKHPHATTGEEGTTGYEEVLQHEGTLLAVYNIPTTYPASYVRLRTPQGFQAVINESYAGDIFFHYGTVLVALRLSEPFAWTAASDVHDHPAHRLGVVVETAHPSAYPGTAQQQLLAFKQDVQQHALAFTIQDNLPKLNYITIHDDDLLIKYDSKRKINGQRIRPEETWPLLDNPWMQQAMEGDVLVVETCKHRMVYDFGAWTKHVTESTQYCADNTMLSLASQSQPVPSLSEASAAGMPETFSLAQNYPNPFNPTTSISYTLHEDASVSLTIYTLLGQEVATLVADSQPRGTYTVQWEARDRTGQAVATGMYLYRLQAGEEVQTKRMLLIK